MKKLSAELFLSSIGGVVLSLSFFSIIGIAYFRDVLSLAQLLVSLFASIAFGAGLGAMICYFYTKSR
jgi:hypothetical protein